MTTSGHLVLMLEDDADRVARFAAVLASHTVPIDFRHWRSAQDFLVELEASERAPALICLDHDLLVDTPGDPDPGDGRDVARFLATRRPCCPILIHSSNSVAADSMLFTLADAGWNVEKIAPIGEDWVEAYWFLTAKRWLGP